MSDHQEHTLGSAPIDEKVIEQMNFAASQLQMLFNDALPPERSRTGFVLMVFPTGDNSGDTTRCNYISNVTQRDDIIRLFEEQLNHFRTDSDDDDLMLQYMAEAIGSVYAARKGMPVKSTPLKAAEAALAAYRRGPKPS